MVAFQNAENALAWCLDTQEALLDTEWPEDILDHPSGAVVLMPASVTKEATANEGSKATHNITISNGGGKSESLPYLFRGLRVRMGIHTGLPQAEYNPRTNSVDYFGPMVYSTMM